MVFVFGSEPLRPHRAVYANEVTQGGHLRVYATEVMLGVASQADRPGRQASHTRKTQPCDQRVGAPGHMKSADLWGCMS